MILRRGVSAWKTSGVSKPAVSSCWYLCKDDMACVQSHARSGDSRRLSMLANSVSLSRCNKFIACESKQTHAVERLITVIINYYDISSITRVQRARNMKVQCVIMNMRSMNVFNFLRSIQVLGTGDVYFTRSKISTRRKKKNIETTTTRMNHHKRKSWEPIFDAFQPCTRKKFSY